MSGCRRCWPRPASVRAESVRISSPPVASRSTARSRFWAAASMPKPTPSTSTACGSPPGPGSSTTSSTNRSAWSPLRAIRRAAPRWSSWSPRNRGSIPSAGSIGRPKDSCCSPTTARSPCGSLIRATGRRRSTSPRSRACPPAPRCAPCAKAWRSTTVGPRRPVCSSPRNAATPPRSPSSSTKVATVRCGACAMRWVTRSAV